VEVGPASAQASPRPDGGITVGWSLVAPYSSSPPSLFRADGQSISFLSYRLGYGWQPATIPLAATSVGMAASDDESVRVFGIVAGQLRALEYRVRVVGVATVNQTWQVPTLPGPARWLFIPRLTRDSIDSGDLGGRGFVAVAQGNDEVVWSLSWDTAESRLDLAEGPLFTMPRGGAQPLMDTRWFVDSAGRRLHRHGLLVSRANTWELWRPRF
jgi:hypothetical protein